MKFPQAEKLARAGFWLDKNTFIMADKVEIEMVARKTCEGPYGKSEKVEMLIFTNAVEMIVDSTGKILGLNNHQKFGLWVDAVENAIEDVCQQKKHG